VGGIVIALERIQHLHDRTASTVIDRRHHGLGVGDEDPQSHVNLRVDARQGERSSAIRRP
jgi:hypothetical protein